MGALWIAKEERKGMLERKNKIAKKSRKEGRKEGRKEEEEEDRTHRRI